jgi:hypothetical protein
MADELIDAAEGELEQAVEEWNVTAEQLTPEGRIRLANTYALVSIAKSLDRLAGQQPAQFDPAQFDPAEQPY